MDGLAEHFLLDWRLLHAHPVRGGRDSTGGPNGSLEICGHPLK